MQTRKEIIQTELFRKSIHICTAFIPILLSLYSKSLILGLLSCALVGYIVSESLRYHGHKIPLVSCITEHAARNGNAKYFVLGPVTLSVGVLITALFFEPLPAKIGIWALAFGDGFASLIGKLIGHTEIPHTNGKTVAGSLACFCATFISCFVASQRLVFSLTIGLCGAIIELIPMRDYDNVVIPIIIALIAQIYFHM
ncbi:MAG: hypothetical protein BKP49_05475 [Treponema sp. CETP13]|nr:MAG: hypothetical protein BKP49_05475 [Treponema sp. CETP13]